MLFSVIVPTYNRLQFLRTALASIWRQTFTDYEIIVVDDGSTDDTWNWLQGLQSRIRVFRQDNLGPSSARNLAASHAQGDYLAFLDSDDFWVPSALDSYAVALRKHGNAALVRASWIEFTGTPPSEQFTSGPVRVLAYRDYFQAGEERGIYVGAGLIAVRRDYFLDVGGFDRALKFAEDHDLALRLGERKGCLVVESPCQVVYRRHESSLTHNMNNAIKGVRALLDRERAGVYPGGSSRRAARRNTIMQIARPVSITCLRQGLWRGAWKLYRELLPWTLAGRRWKYLLAFPIYSALCALSFQK
jgi:glycosyltransferase involved in cell wall biosynthesis